MRLAALRLHNVRRFAGRGVAVEAIGSGVNVLCAANEYGKSTCFDALHALFFQPYSGTPEAIRSLRPYSGGNPLIEADVITADGEFRLSKQYYGGKRATVTDLRSGRLRAQADEAERFIADLVRGGSAGPAGLLWVRQGNTGIEKKQDKEEKRARESVLSSVKGEVEAMTGGRRMTAAIAFCEEELAQLVTPTGRAKANSLYAQAIETRDELAQAEQRLEAEVSKLRSALDARRRARSRLAEVAEPNAEAARRTEFEAAEKAFKTAEAHGEALKNLEAEAKFARDRRDGAKARLDAYRAASSRAEALSDQHGAAEVNRNAAIERQRKAAMANEAAAAAVETAEQAERAARTLLARLERAGTARAAGEKLVTQRAALDQAEAAQKEIQDGEAALRGLVIAADKVEALARLETEIVGLRAADAVQSPSLRIEYRTGIVGSVSIDGAPLAEGEDYAVTSTIGVEIAGVGTLTVRPHRGTPQAGDLVRAEAGRQDLLKTLGVDTLTEARRRDAEARELAAKIHLAKQRLSLLAPKGMTLLRDDIARLERDSRLASPTDHDLDLQPATETARLELEQAERQVAVARDAVRETRPARDGANLAVVNAEKALIALSVELEAIAAMLGPEAARADRKNSLSREFSEADGSWMAAEERAAPLRAAQPDLAGVEATLRRTRSVIATAEQEIRNLREEVADLGGAIRTRSEDAVEEAWQEAKAGHAAASTRVAQFERQVKILTRLRDALDAARTTARDHYFEPVMKELRPLLGLLFDDAAVVFDDDTLLPRSVQRNGQVEEVERLSGGMREQLAVLTRLAFARLLAGEGHPTPLILDDALVYSDDDRIEKMFDALHRQSHDQQIIVFSCRQRAFARLGGNVLRLTEWSPSQV